MAGTSVACNIALNLVLIPRYGIDGAAWASTASYSVLFATTLVIYRRVAGVPVRAVLVPIRADGPAYLGLARRALLPFRRRQVAGVNPVDQR